MSEVYKVWCEWDIGLGDVVFSKWSVAEAHAIEALESCGIEESYTELEDSGMIGVESLEVIKK